MNAGLREFARFCLVGTLGFVAATAILYAMLAAGAGYYLGYGIAFLLTVTLTWWLNRRFTFDDRSAGYVRQWAQFVASNAVGGICNYGVYAALVSTSSVARELPILATALGSVAGLAVNFLAAKRVVFSARPAARGRI